MMPLQVLRYIILKVRNKCIYGNNDDNRDDKWFMALNVIGKHAHHEQLISARHAQVTHPQASLLSRNISAHRQN